MALYSYDIRGYKSEIYSSLTELRKNFMKSGAFKLSKKKNAWIIVYMQRADGSDDYVGMISADSHFKNGVWTDMDTENLYDIDSSGKLKRIPGVVYPARYNAYPVHERLKRR